MTILLLSAGPSDAFANNRKDSKRHVRGGFTKAKPRGFSRFSPRMVISSSQLLRKHKGGVLGKRHERTRVRYTNDDDNGSVLLLPPRQKSPGGLLFPVNTEETRVRTIKKQPAIKSLDLAIFFTYLCSSIAMNLPILLLPMAAAEHATGKGVSSLVVSITSIAIMGGGLGKVVNGFVCQEVGGKTCSAIYLVGSALCSLFFSMASPATLGWTYAGIEFFASIQWTALSVIFAQHYQGNAASFAAGITSLSLASTCGQLLSKFLGMTLLQYLHWRTVAQLGAIVALMGSCIVHAFVKERPSTKPAFQWKHVVTSIQDSASNVLSNPLFWAIGYAHAMAMVARSSDRILGEFFSNATSLSSELECWDLCVDSFFFSL